MFDPYFTTKPGGTGLGLSSVHSIVKRHGGRVEVASAQQAGTTFTLHLPAAPSAAPPATADASAAAAAPTGHGRILIMDDEPLIRGLASRTLAALGYEPVPAADGATAVSAFREAREQGAPFRAVLLDLTVPGGMGGKEAAARILEIDPAAVLVVSTGYSNDPIMSDFQAYGFAGAVAKPYVASALAAEMTRLLADGPQG